MGGKILQETQTSTAQVLIQRLAVVFDRQAIVAKLVRYRNKGHLAVKIALPGDTCRSVAFEALGAWRQMCSRYAV